MGFKVESEAKFQDSVSRLAGVTKWLHYHTLSSVGSASGFPDSTLVKGKRLVFAELKKKTGKYSEAQNVWLQALAAVETVEVYRWRPADWNSEIVPVLTKGDTIPLPEAVDFSSQGMHRHLCPRCGTMWAHKDTVSDAPTRTRAHAHQCPKCKRLETTVYVGSGGPAYTCHHEPRV